MPFNCTRGFGQSSQRPRMIGTIFFSFCAYDPKNRELVCDAFRQDHGGHINGQAT